MSTRSSSSPRFSRRLLVGSSLAGAALLPLGSTRPAAAAASHPSRRQDAATSPAGWRTWILSAPDELRPPAPADPTEAEIAELLAFQDGRTDEVVAAVTRWASRPAVLVWTDLANAAYEELGLSPIRQYRANALLQTAMYDAVIAAYDAQDAYATRPRPRSTPGSHRSRASPGIAPSFPSEHAAVAGAAEAVLTALLPDAKPGRFTALADEAATTRLQAGLNFRRDTDAGLALGRAMANAPSRSPRTTSRLGLGQQRAADRPRILGTDPTRLRRDAAGTARIHLAPLGADRADQFRPAPPPAYGTPGWQSQLTAVQEAVARRTFAQARAANFWQGAPPPSPGTTSPPTSSVR